MFTSIDKAIVALLGAIVFLIAQFSDLPDNFISAEILQSAAAIITALLVYFVPNKKKSPQTLSESRENDKSAE